MFSSDYRGACAGDPMPKELPDPTGDLHPWMPGQPESRGVAFTAANERQSPR
jgi:hypothetical protein